MCDLAEALADEGHDVHLLTNRSAAPLPDLHGVSVHRLLVAPLWGRFANAALDSAPQNLMHAAAVYREVRRIHEQEHPVDAVLAPLWRSEGAVCTLDDSFPTIVSCMTSIQTLTEVDPPSRLIPDIHERLSLEREALRRCRYLHGLTDAVLAKTISDYRLEPDAAAVIGRGIRDRRAQGRSAGSHDGPLRVLFVGRLERRKGVDTLLGAARELIDDGVDVNFTLAGPDADPLYREALAAQASQHDALREAVRFTGGVSDSELIRLYAESDIVCVPSRYESHGIVLLEAMMFGKPIVTCDAGGIGEVVEDDADALLVAPDDARALADGLRRVVSDAGLRSRLGAAARETYERRFDVHKVARRMQSFIEEVVVLNGSVAAASGAVKERLERLLSEVMTIDPRSASEVCTELLDPFTSGPLRRVRETALQSPAPRLRAGPDAPRLTAIVVTRDRPELLVRALDSLEQAQVPLRILVIDNDSASAAARRLAADCSQRPLVQLRRSDSNLGCAGGRRLGVELADTELVLFLDDDAELMPGALEHLVAELDSDPSVGAVTATVVGADGLVLHSGGLINRTDELATFEPLGRGLPLDSADLPASGPTDWVPHTVAVIRRSLLSEFEIDERMSACFEDAEWCYRVSLERPAAFRRSREALAVHHVEPRALRGASFEGQAATVQMAAACARFYERHGVLLGPPLFDIVPELRDRDGRCDLIRARLLMDLLTAKGSEWTLAAWMRGDLTVLLDGKLSDPHLRRVEAEFKQLQAENAVMRAELERLRQAVSSQDATLGILRARDEALWRIEQGGWWRLRGRLLPLLRLVGWLRGTHRRSGARTSVRAPLAPAADIGASSSGEANEG